jgi:hypothetical protein
MISYSTNWMGPVNTEWYRERGLTRRVTTTVTEDSVLVELGRKNVGDVLEYDEVTEYYSAGRIDIRDDSKEGYDGWDEYSLAPMHGEDWNRLSDWLDNLETERLWGKSELLDAFEEETGYKIRWAEDTWYKCYECTLITDLREYPDRKHKMGCTRKWDQYHE